MGLVELIIVVLLILWLFGYFGRGRFAMGPAISDGTSVRWGGNWIHTLLVIVVILVILRLLGVV